MILLFYLHEQPLNVFRNTTKNFIQKKKLIKNNCDKHGNCYQGTRLTSGEHNQFLYLTIKNTTMETFK